MYCCGVSLSSDEVKTWLEEIHRTRQWLAEELGLHPGTLKNQFTAGHFPPWVEKAIRRLMDDFRQPKVRMTEEEWDLLEQARRMAGYDDRQAFYYDAMMELARQIMAGKQVLKAAEEPKPYEAKGK